MDNRHSERWQPDLHEAQADQLDGTLIFHVKWCSLKGSIITLSGPAVKIQIYLFNESHG